MNKIRKIELEISSYCNRSCPWCSNTIYKRNFKKNMEDEIFFKVIDELQRIGFDKNNKVITFSKFNEPLMDFEYFSLRVKQLRLYLPNITLSVNTNGDYLIKEIFDLPIDKIAIMDYDSNGNDYCLNVLKNIGCSNISNDIREDLISTYKDVEIRYVVNFKENFLLEDRGGILNDSSLNFNNDKCIRKIPCLIQNRPLSIDYLGNVTPCCHIRGDADKHKDFIMGNILDNYLFEIINNEKFNRFNRIMEGGNIEDYFYPCLHCQKNV